MIETEQKQTGHSPATQAHGLTPSEQELLSKILQRTEQQAIETLRLIGKVRDAKAKALLLEELPQGLDKEGLRMHNKVKEYVNEPLDAAVDFSYLNPDTKLIFAKFVLGGFIVAADENHNIMIFNDRCEKLQMLPYGKEVTDACASPYNIFIAIR